MRELTLNYRTGSGKGQMTLNLREFFPCTKAVLKKILKVVDMTDEPELHKADLILYLNERMDEAANEKDRRVLANRVVDYREKAKGLDEKIEKLEKQKAAYDELIRVNTRNKEERVKCKNLRAEVNKKLKEVKDEQRHYINIAASSEKMFNELIASEEKFKALLAEMGQVEEAEDGSTN